MKEWIQLRKKKIAFICVILFAEGLPLLGAYELLEQGWGVWTLIVLAFTCILVAIDWMTPVIQQAFKKI